MAVIGLVLLLVPWFPGHRGPGYSLGGSTLQLAAAAGLMAGAWLALSTNRGNMRSRRMWRFVGRVVVWICASWAFGEVVWYLTFALPPEYYVSFRFYTAWCALEIVTIVVLYGALADRMQTAWPRAPVRVLAPLCAVLVAVATRVPFAEPLQEAPNQASSTRPDEVVWLEALEKRLGSVPSGDPVVVVAASGGGSRAAIFSALVFESLRRQPFPTPASKKTWSDHTLFVSGVSGGSLGTSIYVSDLVAPRAPNKGVLRNSHRADLLGRVAGHAEDMASSSKDPEVKRLWEAIGAEAEAIAAGGKGDDSELARALSSPVVDDACADFMAPILRGALATNISRGESLWQFWTEYNGWGASNSWNGYAVRGKDPAYDFTKTPLVLFNTTDVASGRRVAVGFPPLPTDFFGASLSRRAETVDDFGDPRAIALAQAVGLSANFPFGFNVVELPGKPGNPRHFVDGGVVDNTGIDSLRETFDGVRRRAFDFKNPLRGRYRKVWDELRSRGVVLVEIDSGAKPGPPGGATAFLSVLLEPVDALNNVAYATANETKSAHMKAMADSLRHPVELGKTLDRLLASEDAEDAEDRGIARDLVDEGVERLLHVPLVCSHPGEDNVMTAWSLGPSDKAMVLARFLLERKTGDAVTEANLRRFIVPIPAQIAEVQKLAKGMADRFALRQAARAGQAMAAQVAAVDNPPAADRVKAAGQLEDFKKNIDETKRAVASLNPADQRVKDFDDLSAALGNVAKSYKSGLAANAKDLGYVKSAVGGKGPASPNELNELVKTATSSKARVPETPAQRAERTRREVDQAPPKNAVAKPIKEKSRG